MLARSYPDGVIGLANKLPWKLKTDLRRFQSITKGHAIVMGRRTFESIGRPLPNRINIVLSRELTTDMTADFGDANSSGLYFVNSSESALYLADLFTIARRLEDFFVVGGAEVYKTLIDLDIVHRVYLTEVFCDVEGDAYYREKFEARKWKLLQESDKVADDEDEFGYRFSIYQRRKRKNRYRFRNFFFTDQVNKSDWVENYIAKNRKIIEQYEFEFAAQQEIQYSFEF